MPLWEEYKTIARSRGALAMELYVVQSAPVAAPELLQEILPDHLAYQEKLEAEGVLALAGPVSDESGDQMQGAGMMIYRAADMATARAYADADPMHAKGARCYTIRKWLVNEGKLQFTVSLSNQRANIT